MLLLRRVILFITKLLVIFVLIELVFIIIFKFFHRKDFFILGASVAATEFFQLVQIGFLVYVPYGKFQVSPHSSLRFLTSCASSITHNHLLRLY